MAKRTTLLFLLATAAAAATAGDIYRCEADDGHVTFSQSPCGPVAAKVYVDTSLNGTGGLREGEMLMLDEVRARDAVAAERTLNSRERYGRNHVGFSDRQRIRDLEREKRTLQKQLSSGTSVGQGWAIGESVRGIDRQIEQIRSPKW